MVLLTPPFMPPPFALALKPPCAFILGSFKCGSFKPFIAAAISPLTRAPFRSWPGGWF